MAVAAAAKLLQSCLTLHDPRDGSPPGSPVPGILQARTLEWVAISFSNAWRWKVKVKSLSRVRLLATPWTAAHQVPPSMGFSRQEYWSGVLLHLESCYLADFWQTHTLNLSLQSKYDISTLWKCFLKEMCDMKKSLLKQCENISNVKLFYSRNGYWDHTRKSKTHPSLNSAY